MARQVTTLGDEEINAEALASIQETVMEGEQILFQSGFDWGSKVIALTNLAIFVGDESEGVVGFFPHEEARAIRRDRTLIVSFIDESGQQEKIRYQMGDGGVVGALVRNINRLRRQRESELAETNADATDNPAHENGHAPHLGTSTDLIGEESSIGDRVKFWEEQHKINQVLIPRVIRQSELLTKHIGEHDNLPQVAGNAISQALTGARDEQRQQYEAALDAAKTELREQTKTSLTQALEQLKAALATHASELNKQTQATLQKALDDIQMALTASKTEISEQAQTSLAQTTEQLQAALTTHKGELSEQAQSGLDQALTALREESRKARNLLVGIASGSCAIGIVAIIVAVLT